jgi:hypothetical protein
VVADVTADASFCEHAVSMTFSALQRRPSVLLLTLAGHSSTNLAGLEARNADFGRVRL